MEQERNVPPEELRQIHQEEQDSAEDQPYTIAELSELVERGFEERAEDPLAVSEQTKHLIETEARDFRPEQKEFLQTYASLLERAVSARASYLLNRPEFLLESNKAEIENLIAALALQYENPALIGRATTEFDAARELTQELRDYLNKATQSEFAQPTPLVLQNILSRVGQFNLKAALDRSRTDVEKQALLQKWETISGLIAARSPEVTKGMPSHEAEELEKIAEGSALEEMEKKWEEVQPIETEQLEQEYSVLSHLLKERGTKKTYGNQQFYRLEVRTRGESTEPETIRSFSCRRCSLRHQGLSRSRTNGYLKRAWRIT